MKYLRQASYDLSNAPPRAGLRIIALVVAVMFSAAATAQVQFTDDANSAGIAAETYVSRTTHNLGVNWIDYDNDGWPDLFAVNGFNGSGAHLYRNEGNGAFSDQDALLPALANVEMMGSVFADFDNDGDSDIYIFTDNENGPVGPSAGPVNILLQNQWVENGNQVIPGQPLFVDVAAAAGVEDLLSAALPDGPALRSSTGGWLDYDRDGNVDLYVCHWDRGKHGQDTNQDRLYRNMGDGTFQNVTTTSGIIPVDDGTYERPCLAFVGAHLDSDLWPDIYVGNVDAPLPYVRDYVFQNNGAGGFTDRTLDSPGIGDDADAAMGVTVGDIDLNGGWDVYLSDLGGGVAPLNNPLYLHTGADILYNDNSADVAGVTANNSWGVNFLDVDNDGYEDLFVATMSGTGSNILYLNNQGDGTFAEYPNDLGVMLARGSAYADYDRDGDLDIAVSGIDASLQLHRNDSINAGHWLQIQLLSNDTQVGLQSNRDAIGTLVLITANGQTYRRQVIGGDSGHGQNSLDLHFGLGAATTIDQIEVFWPSGATLILTNQPVDTFMAISELGASVALVSPLPTTAITNATTTFDWMSDGVVAIESWRIMAGTTPGSSDFFDSGDLADTQMSADVTGLPTDGTQVFVRLQYQLDGMSHHIDYQYGTANPGPPPPAGTPIITSPLDGDTLAGSSETFAWSAEGAAVEKWRLEVGTVPDGTDIFAQLVDAAVTSTVVSGLPTDGSTVYVNLKWRITGTTSVASYSYIASSDGSPPPPPAGTPIITSPLDGDTLAGSSETFAWSAEGAAVEKWRLEVGTAPDGTDIFAQLVDAAVTSTVVSGLPTDGSTVYVNLKWRITGTTSVASYSYIASSDGSPPPPPAGTPTITSPLDGDTLAGSSETFAWSAEGAAVDRWRLEVGTTPDSRDLFVQGYNSGVTSAVVNGLPTDGSTVYVNLKWRDSGVVSVASFVYTAAGP